MVEPVAHPRASAASPGSPAPWPTSWLTSWIFPFPHASHRELVSRAGVSAGPVRRARPAKSSIHNWGSESVLGSVQAWTIPSSRTLATWRDCQHGEQVMDGRQFDDLVRNVVGSRRAAGEQCLQFDCNNTQVYVGRCTPLC